MARPYAPEIELSDEERAELERRLRAHTTPQQQAVRARILLLAAEGLPNREIGKRLGLSRNTVELWRSRFARAREGERMQVLEDLPRSGRPRRFPPSDPG